MLISCHFPDCKVPLVVSLTHVNSAIPSTDLYLYYKLRIAQLFAQTEECFPAEASYYKTGGLKEWQFLLHTKYIKQIIQTTNYMLAQTYPQCMHNMTGCHEERVLGLRTKNRVPIVMTVSDALHWKSNNQCC